MINGKIFMLGIGIFLTVGSLQGQNNSELNSKANVLIIIMDDMADWTSYLGGNNQVLTPNLDKLAARGVTFTNAYTAVPLCNPSRTALLTGIQPYISGVYTNEDEISNFPIVNNSIMMPQHFRDNGYTTICSGKIFHTKPTPDVMTRCWDDMTNIDGGYGPFIKNQTLPLNLQQKWQNFEAWTAPDTDFPDVVNSQKIIDYLGQSHDKPFFAMMGFYRPHYPYTAPKRYFDLYDINQIIRPTTLPDDLSDVPQYAIDNFTSDEERQHIALLNSTGNYCEQLLRASMACISFADDRIGMILDALETSPYADNTLIVLIGDNGFHHGEKEHWAKKTLWREACHVPFIIVPPKSNDNIAIGNFASPVNLIDIYPTLVDACNLPKIDNQLAGNSLMPVITDLNAQYDKPSITTYLPGNFTVHADKWNLIKYANNSYELYNISNDENEFINLANNPEHTVIVDSLSSFLPTSWITGETSDSLVNFISEDFSTDEWAAEFLRLNPTYIKPSIGQIFGISTPSLYFKKYALKGACVAFSGTPNCVLPGTIHGNNSDVVAFRLSKYGLSSYIELPKIANAGLITLHVRNGNASTETKLILQEYDLEAWTTIDSIVVQPSGAYSATSIDEVITYPVNINEVVKLRICGGDKFVSVFKIEVTPYNWTGLLTHKTDFFKIYGRKIVFPKPNRISVYNMLGALVFESNIQSEIKLPESLGRGIFIVKCSQGSQKIFLQ